MTARPFRWCLPVLLLAGQPWAAAKTFAEITPKRSQHGYWQMDLRGEAAAPEACRPWQVHAGGFNTGNNSRTISATFWSLSTGAEHREGKTERASANTVFEFPPGENEPVRLELVWQTEFGVRKTTTELPRLPLPMGFRVRAGTDSVALSWDGIRECPGLWQKGPEFVVLRLESSQLRFGYVSVNEIKRRCLLPTAEPREVFRADATVTEWTDRQVEPGKSYVYGLLIRGTMQATTTFGDGETGVVAVPVEIAAPPHRWDQEDLFVTDWRCTRVATPGPARPARLALFHSEEYAPVLETEVQRLTKALGARGDMEIVERGIATALLEEQDLQAMGGEGVQAVVAADLLVETRLRTMDEQVFRDTWLHDFLNADSRRIASFPAREPVGEAEIAGIAAAVRKAFPRIAPRKATRPEAGTDQTATLAVVPPERLGDTSGADAALLTNLLVAEFDQTGLRLVDRERTSEAFRELETDALGDRAAELGRTVGADFFVAGNWGMVGTGEVRGTFRLVRARDGLLVFAGDFSAPDPGELAAAVAARLAPLAVGSAAAQPTGVMHRLLEARALYRARDERRLRERAGHMWQWEKQKDGETAALTAPEDAAGIAETARHYLRLGQTDRALDFLRNRLAKTGNTGSFWEAAEPLAGILREKGETTSEVLLWQGLLDQTPPTDINYGCMALLLAEVLAQQGRNEEALTWLERVVSPPQELGKEDFRMYRKGRLLEKLGRHREAAIAYTEDCRHHLRNIPVNNMFWRAWRPSLTAMVRLLGDPERSETHDVVRREILGWHLFPRQAAQAARELLQTGCTDRETLWLAFLALLAEGDEEAARAAMHRLLTQGTGGIAMPRHVNFYAASQRVRRARADAVGTALFAAAKLPTPLSEAEACDRIAAAFGQAPPLPAAPAEPRTAVKPTDFIMHQPFADALGRLDKGDTLLCLGRDRLWALVPDGAPLGAVAWSDQWDRGRGIPMGFGEAFGDISRASAGENGMVVVAAGGSGELRAYDVAKGAMLWQHTCWVPVYRPILRQGRAYVVTGAREMLVLDLASGELLERVPPPLEAEVFRPTPASVVLMEDGRAIHHRGPVTVHYSLAPRSVATVQQPLPDRTDQRPSLLDAFCGQGKTPGPAPARREPTKLDGMMAVFLDAGKPVRERLKETRMIVEELKRAPDPAHKRALARLAADQSEDLVVRRSALGILNQLPDNPGACLGIPLIRENEAFVEIGLSIMARESDAAWIEAVQALKARPSTDWGRWQKLEELVTKGNLERTARDGFLAPEIGWDQTAVDRALGEFLVSRQVNHPESCTFWHRVAAWTGSQHLPRLEGIVVGQMAGDRTTPIEVREGEPWTGTAREAVAMVRGLDMVQPAPRHIPILAAALRPSPDMADWNLRTARVLAGQQLLRIGTPEAIGTALANPQPLGTVEKEINRGLDLLEQASGRSFGTLPEWQLWWRTQNPEPPPGAP